MLKMIGTAACLVLGAQAMALPTRASVESLPPLLRAAIDSPDGASYGVIENRYTLAVQRQFKTGAPVLVDVTTLARYRQPGCSRLNIRVRQEAVVLPGQSARPKMIDVGMDYCRDGKAPQHPLQVQ